MHLAVNSLKITGGSLRIKSAREGSGTQRLSSHGVHALAVASGVFATPQVLLRLDLVEKICSFLELRGLKCEGIFRISGNSVEVSDLYSKFPLRKYFLLTQSDSNPMSCMSSELTSLSNTKSNGRNRSLWSGSLWCGRCTEALLPSTDSTVDTLREIQRLHRCSW